MGIRMVVVSIGIASFAAAGCGGGDSAWPPAIGGNQAPVIEHLHVDHDDPEAPGIVRAVAQVEDPDGDAVEVDFEWKVAGVALAETGPELTLRNARKGTRIELTATARDARTRSEPALRVVHVRNPQPEPRVDSWRKLRPSDEAERASARGSANGFASAATFGEMAADTEAERESSDDGEPLRYAVETPAGDGTTAGHFRLLLGPEGMWVHPASGEVTWLPEPWQTDTYPVEVEVTDASGTVTVEMFDVSAGFEEPDAPLPAKIAEP